MGRRVRRTYTLLIAVVLSTAATTILVLHALGITNTGVRLEFQTISKGAWSGYTSHAYYVIQNMEDWRRVWRQHQEIFIPLRPPPEIDFSETTVIAVFMGPCPTTGYDIEVKEIIDTGFTVVVKVERVYPGKNCVVGEALTYPYHIVKTSKINKQVVFQTSERTVSCS